LLHAPRRSKDGLPRIEQGRRSEEWEGNKGKKGKGKKGKKSKGKGKASEPAPESSASTSEEFVNDQPEPAPEELEDEEAAQEEEEARAAAGNESSEEGDGAKTTEIDDAWRTMAKELMVERSRACADAARSATIAAGMAVDAARSLWILAGMAVDAEHKETAYSSYVLAEQAKKKADECEKQAAEFVAFARRLDPMFY